MDWDSLGGLLDIPYNERDEIRRNHIDYPDSINKAEKILAIYNEQHNFSRNMLRKCFEEMDRDDILLEIEKVFCLEIYSHLLKQLFSANKV